MTREWLLSYSTSFDGWPYHVRARVGGWIRSLDPSDQYLQGIADSMLGHAASVGTRRSRIWN